MDRPSIWDPLFVCQMGPGPREQSNTCCGYTKNSTPCKNMVKKQDLKEGRQKLRNLSERPFDIPYLRPVLCDIASNFLCARWHRRSQTDQVGQKWFEAATRNQHHARGPHTLLPSTPEVGISRSPPPTVRNNMLGQEGVPHSANSRRSVDRTHLTSRQPIAPGLDHADSTSPRNLSRQVTVTMLRERQVLWQVSQGLPAILCVANAHGGQHTLELKSFEPGSFGQGSEPDDLECYICHCEEEESVTLKCGVCSCIVHLGCMERWLAVRPAGYHTSCTHCRTESAFDAKIQPPVPDSTVRETRTEEAMSRERDTGASITESNLHPDNASQRSSNEETGTNLSRSTAQGVRFHEESERYNVRRSARLARRSNSSQDFHYRRPARLSMRLSQGDGSH